MVTLLPVLAVLTLGAIPFSASAETGVSLTSGNVVLSIEDGTLLTLAPGTELTLGDGQGGPPLVNLGAGEIYLSSVFSRGGILRVRAGEMAFELGRASILFSRKDGALSLTLLHGSEVLNQGRQRCTLTPGTRLIFGGDGGAPRIDRPGPGVMAGIMGRTGAGGGPGAAQGTGTRGPRGGQGRGGPGRDPLRGFGGRAMQMDEFLAVVGAQQGMGLSPSPHDEGSRRKRRGKHGGMFGEQPEHEPGMEMERRRHAGGRRHDGPREGGHRRKRRLSQPVPQ